APASPSSRTWSVGSPSGAPLPCGGSDERTTQLALLGAADFRPDQCRKRGLDALGSAALVSRAARRRARHRPLQRALRARHRHRVPDARARVRLGGVRTALAAAAARDRDLLPGRARGTAPLRHGARLPRRAPLAARLPRRVPARVAAAAARVARAARSLARLNPVAPEPKGTPPCVSA